jgi:hypothetical protein
LFGVKPGEKYEKEGWEGPIYWGFCGSMVVAVVAYAFKPDTRYVCEMDDTRRWREYTSITQDQRRCGFAQKRREDESTSSGGRRTDTTLPSEHALTNITAFKPGP